MSQANESLPDLEWVALCKDLEAEHRQESIWEKIKRKSNDNPFVPIGCAATLFALSYGLWSFKEGKVKRSQNLMRMRVAAQGFTIAAFVVGLGMTAVRNASPR